MSFIIAVILITAFACRVDAQNTRSKTLQSSVWYVKNADNVSLSTSGDSVAYYTVLLNKADDVFYDVQIQLDSVSGTPDYDIDLKGKVFADDSWTDLETDVTWDGTSSDTTILFQEHSTAVFHRYIQLQVNGQAGTGAATIDKIEIKVWK